MEIIKTEQAPMPLGHYAQAVAHNGLLFVSGQLAIYPSGEPLTHASITQEAELIFSHLDAIFQTAHTQKTNVLLVTVYITDLTFMPEFNTAFAKYFGNHTPARAATPVKILPLDLQIELMCTCAIP